jgi:hypothetical protein
MHLQWYSIDTRDVKRITDIKNLLSKVNIEITKGVQLKDLIKDEYQTWITINDNSGAITNIWIINFENLKEDQRSFQDPLNGRDYPFAFAEWATEVDWETENYKFLQMATINERSRTTRLVWYYFQYKPKDSPSLFVNEEWRRMEDNSWPMIYPIEDSSFLTLPIAIPVVGM